jgi:hypothetical protein
LRELESEAIRVIQRFARNKILIKNKDPSASDFHKRHLLTMMTTFAMFFLAGKSK